MNTKNLTETSQLYTDVTKSKSFINRQRFIREVNISKTIGRIGFFISLAITIIGIAMTNYFLVMVGFGWLLAFYVFYIYTSLVTAK